MAKPGRKIQPAPLAVGAHRGLDAASAASLRDEVGLVLEAFALATGLELCFKPLSARWQTLDGLDLIAMPWTRHRSKFCMATKQKSMPACMKCDLIGLADDCEDRFEPFVRTCHAGADELLFPLWRDGLLVAVLFVGQFTYGASPAGSSELRVLSAEELGRVQRLVLPLRSYLLEMLPRLDGQGRDPATGRQGVIESYFCETLSAGPTLSGLAERLSLSRSRASHVVREMTGRSFQDLLEEYRLAAAKDLLTGSDGTVAWIARQTGFNDVAYFCRYFKEKSGTTPSAFRRRRNRALSV